MSLQGNFSAQANQGNLPGVSQLGGLGRQGWQQLVASNTGPGVNAAQAAANLDPFYRAQRENRGGLQGFNGQQNFSQSGRRVGDWQEAIRQVTQQYGVNASQAAQMLDPYWKGRREAQANTPGTQSSSRRSRSNSRNFGQQQTLNGAANGYNLLTMPQVFGGTPSTGPRGRASGGSGDYPYQQIDMSPRDLGATMKNGQISGLDREGYQVLISQVAGRFGINAAQAAHLLGPLIQSQREGRHLTAQEWTQMISNATQQYGINASQAAQLLDPYVHGARETNTRYDVTNASINQFGAANGYNGLNGTAFYPSGLESSFGMYEGLNSPSKSFRAGTPAESTDVVLDNAESAGVAMIQAATAPARITSRANTNFNETDISRIAQALGIPTQGLTRAALISAIRAQTGAMSPRSQAQFFGSQSPRSQRFLNQQLF